MAASHHDDLHRNPDFPTHDEAKHVLDAFLDDIPGGVPLSHTFFGRGENLITYGVLCALAGREPKPQEHHPVMQPVEHAEVHHEGATHSATPPPPAGKTK